MQTIKLNTGAEMPMVGFGVFQMAPDVCERAVSEALEVGYRLIDTASSYKNESAVGAAIRRSGIPREKLFVTTKVFVDAMGERKTRDACLRSLDALGLDYLDLYLIHMPYGDVFGAWRALEALVREGRLRAIGVSNFQSDRILDLCQNVEIRPAIDQLELHPFYQRADELALLAELGICPQAWAPFAEGLNGLFTNPVLAAIAAAHGKSVAQVALRWNLQRGVPVLPKSTHRNRMVENFAVQAFTLTEAEMAQIATLDLARPQMFDPRSPAEVRRIYDYLNNPVLTTLQ